MEIAGIHGIGYIGDFSFANDTFPESHLVSGDNRGGIHPSKVIQRSKQPCGVIWRMMDSHQDLVPIAPCEMGRTVVTLLPVDKVVDAVLVRQEMADHFGILDGIVARVPEVTTCLDHELERDAEDGLAHPVKNLESLTFSPWT